MNHEEDEKSKKMKFKNTGIAITTGSVIPELERIDEEDVSE
jgi:hypothetical protein